MSALTIVALHFLHCPHAKTVFARFRCGSYSALNPANTAFLGNKVLN
ncbi:hypothetical protein [Xanthomonas translucens]|nr:hypothetical protein [Xanthomonas translucens]MCC8446453.1 hypothetical protein [Xanthomonas translucens pv. translucens]QSQ34137.1 hypothetical protein ISN31_00155 [Xanthomonas translucens pv. translucens]CCP40272.1 hypothetical protein BN444_01995 [Xanthomonas translucens pv. translucens DSM 18974]